jgi:hypothetical protein
MSENPISGLFVSGYKDFCQRHNVAVELGHQMLRWNMNAVELGQSVTIFSWKGNCILRKSETRE